MRMLFKGQFTIMVSYNGLTDGESYTVALPGTLGGEEGSKIRSRIAAGTPGPVSSNESVIFP